jgi:hypothetical protein
MATQTAISLAILQVNWDERKKDYLDNFVPIIAECVRLQTNEVVSTAVLKTDIEARFGLSIPASAVNTILRRLRKENYIYTKDGVYYRNNEALSSLGFRDVQQSVIRMHDSLIADMLAYCKKEFNLDWTPEEASNNLLACLKENDLQIISAFTSGTLIPDTVLSTKADKYYCALYIKHLQETMSGSLDYLRKLVEGHMLANAIFLPDPMRAAQKFHNTKVFFDTSFLIFALGYAGEPRSAPCTELLQLLYETGAELCCFQHTITEITRVLESCSKRITHGDQTDAFGTIEYFIEKHYSDSDIQILINKLKTSLESIRVRIHEKPPYEPQYVIDEDALGNALEKEINYRSPQARIRDIDSISAIMRLRHMTDYNFIEDCRALFITTNKAVARVSRSFFHAHAQDSSIPPCITDYSLTNLLWLKKPLKMPDLPMKRIIADCYAALQPDEKLVRAYLTKIDNMKQQREITEEEVFMLRYSLEARQALMELTSGDEDVLTNVTVQELLQITKEKLLAKERAEIESRAQQKVKGLAQERDKYKWIAADQSKKLRKATGKIQELAVLQRTRDEHITLRAQKISRFIANSIGLLLMFGLILGSIFLFPFDLPSFPEAAWRYIGTLSFVILIIFTFVNYITGVHVLSIIRAISLKLEKPIRRVIDRFTS